MTAVKDRVDAVRERLRQPPPGWPTFSAAVRDTALTAHIGRILGIGFALCFVTGLYSHYQYGPLPSVPVPTVPSWGYRLTQGIHVITGIALIPMTLAKLWSVYPKLFTWPVVAGWKSALERLSIAILVSSALIELVTGFLNVLTWYAWPWNFVQVHFWLAFVVFGSVLLHLAIKWPLIIEGLRTRLGRPADGPATVAADTGSLAVPAALVDRVPSAVRARVPAVKPGGLTRRGAFLAVAAGVGATVLTTVGQTFSPLESISLLSPRRPSKGPLGVPINRTAQQAQVIKSAADPAYLLLVDGPTGSLMLTLDELVGLTNRQERWPIACVEGWSALADWRGFSLFDLVRRVGATSSSVVQLKSLEVDGPFRSSQVQGPDLTTGILATHLNGERLTVDHGYPVRFLAPGRAGVLNTKWLSHLVVS